MGALRNILSRRTVMLPHHAVAGRAPASDVPLADSKASNDHASISWTGERWEARDLGSTNGTLVGSYRLQRQENFPLARGAVLQFGCEAESWELVDERGPAVVARSLTTGEERVMEDGLLALPSPKDMLVSIFADSSGKWLLEDEDGARRPVRDREQVVVAGHTWELSVPPQSPVGGTVKESRFGLAMLTLRFCVSPDERHVHVEALNGQDRLVLEERACFFLLLRLVRQRLEDMAKPALPESEHGWTHVVDLMVALKKDEQGVNSDVHRARKVIAEAHIEGAEGIVARRPREIRIGTGRIEVVTG